MNIPGWTFWPVALAGLLALAGCEKKSAPAPAPSSTPVPQAEEGYAGVSETSAPASSSSPTIEPVGVVDVPTEVNLNLADSENQLVKNEVLARIDVMPNLTPEDKDKLYVQVERARRMGRIITIPFASGKTTIGFAEATALMEKLRLPQIQRFTDDPTVVFVVLGFADKKGDEKKNLAISLQRAQSVVQALKERSGVMNVVHAVGMGSSEMFDSQNLDKNRVVEVWAVLP